MFYAWNFDTWFGSLVTMLFMGSIIIGFAMFVTALLSGIFGREQDIAEMSPMTRTTKKASFRKAA